MVLGWRRSGLSSRAYAAMVGVSASSLYRWWSLLLESSVDRPGFVEVVPSAPESSWEVELPAGTLRVRGSLDAMTTKAIVEALAGARRR